MAETNNEGEQGKVLEGTNFLSRTTERGMEWLRGQLGGGRLEGVRQRFLTLGNWAFFTAAVLIILDLLVIGVAAESGKFVVGALVFIPAAIIGLYVALKMIGAVEPLIQSTRTELTSSAFLDVMGLTAVVAAVLGLIWGIVQALDQTAMQPLYIGITQFVFFAYAAGVALNPGTINVHITRDATIGQEAVGILTFFMKVTYKFVPFWFGLGLLLATIMALETLLLAFGAEGHALMGSAMHGINTLWVFGSACLSPFLAYIAFTIYYLFIDVLRSILLLGQVGGRYAREEETKSSSSQD
jgi:hypothetical protein